MRKNRRNNMGGINLHYLDKSQLIDIIKLFSDIIESYQDKYDCVEDCSFEDMIDEEPFNIELQEDAEEVVEEKVEDTKSNDDTDLFDVVVEQIRGPEHKKTMTGFDIELNIIKEYLGNHNSLVYIDGFDMDNEAIRFSIKLVSGTYDNVFTFWKPFKYVVEDMKKNQLVKELYFDVIMRILLPIFQNTMLTENQKYEICQFNDDVEFYTLCEEPGKNRIFNFFKINVYSLLKLIGDTNYVLELLNANYRDKVALTNDIQKALENYDDIELDKVGTDGMVYFNVWDKDAEEMGPNTILYSQVGITENNVLCYIDEGILIDEINKIRNND